VPPASSRASRARKLDAPSTSPTAPPTTIAAIELADYQRLSRRTAAYPREAWLAYPALGLAGEAGEVAEHAKKAIRDDGGEITDARRSAMAKELGDVLWYVSQLASELGLELADVAQANLEKLLSRQQRGVLSGSGDER
jgi:NTP pyrophosphatase (non-canonical NTP hydrolase)